MANLMTIAQVKSEAFTRKVDDIQFKDTDIAAAEFEYILPVLTENLYNTVVANPSTYTTLIDTYIKPCLAYYVKAMLVESFFTELSDRGMNHLQGQNTQTASTQARTDYKAEVLKKAQIFERRLKDYINQQYYEANADYALYGNTSDVIAEDGLTAGFLIENEIDYNHPTQKKYQ